MMDSSEIALQLVVAVVEEDAHHAGGRVAQVYRRGHRGTLHNDFAEGDPGPQGGRGPEELLREGR